MKNWFRRMQEGGYYLMKKREEQARLRQKLGLPTSFDPSRPSSSELAPTLIGPNATIRRVWVDFDVQQSNRRGMTIHADFTYRKSLVFLGGKRVEGRVTVHFGRVGEGLLMSANSFYRDGTGNVCVARSFKPIVTPFTLSDCALFIPYDELHLPPGQHDLRLWVSIWRTDGKRLAISKPVDFTLDNST